LLALGLLLLGWLVGGVAFGACDENLRAGTTRSDICSSVGTEGSRYLLLLIPPPLLLVATVLTNRARIAVFAAVVLAISECLVLAVVLVGAT
jgi:hypothetical protein